MTSLSDLGLEEMGREEEKFKRNKSQRRRETGEIGQGKEVKLEQMRRPTKLRKRVKRRFNGN